MTLNDRNMLQSLPQIRLCYHLLLVNYCSAVLIAVSGTLLLTKLLPWRIKCVVTHISCTFLNIVELRIVLLGAGVIRVNWSVSTAHKVGLIICDAKVDTSSAWNAETHFTLSQNFLKATNCQPKHVAKQRQRSKHDFTAVIICSLVSSLHPKPTGVSHVYDINFIYAVEYIFHIFTSTYFHSTTFRTNFLQKILLTELIR